MDLEMILQKFAVFSGLTGDALQACLPGLLQAIGVLLISVFGSAWLLDRYVSL